MELVEACEAEAAGGTVRERMIRQHLCRAHEHRRARVDRRITSGQTDLLGTEQVDEIEELLGDEGLDRRGPHCTSTGVQRKHDPSHGDETLPGTGRRRQHDMFAGRERERRLLLMAVQRAPPVVCPPSENIEHR